MPNPLDKTNYIIAGYNNDATMPILFTDCLERKDVRIVKNILPFSTYINGLFKGLLMRFYRSNICQYLFYFIGKLYRPLEKATIDRAKYYLIFTNTSVIGTGTLYLRAYLRRHQNCIPIMLFMDHMDNYWAEYAKFLVKQIPQFKCFTFDPNDAANTGYPHMMSVYSLHTLPNEKLSSDIYISFIGTKRLNTIQAIAEHLEKHKIKSNIICVANPEQNNAVPSAIKYVTHRMPYEEILRHVAQTNCLLEVLRPGQTGVTLRYYEAICYNKKLLTNNKNIVNLPFYDPRYMKIFESPSDIDCQWIRQHDLVDYHYDGEFSPNFFLETVAKF